MVHRILGRNAAGMLADDQRELRLKVEYARLGIGQDDRPAVAERRVGRLEKGIEQASLGLLGFQVVPGQADQLARPGKGRPAADVLQCDALRGIDRVANARLGVRPVADHHLHHLLGRVMPAAGDRSRRIQDLLAVPDTQFVIVEKQKSHSSSPCILFWQS